MSTNNNKSPKPSSHKSFTRPSTPSTKSSRSSFLYSPSHSRSKSSLPHPKVLPFPDIPVRPISHESSRTTSPLPSPALTRRSSSQDANRLIRESQHSSSASSTSTALAVGMVITASSDSGDQRDARYHHPLVSSSSSLNPTSPTASSPLSTSIPNYSSTGIVVEAGPSRLRSQTTPSASATRPIPVPPILNLNHPNRSQGFEPVIVSPPNDMSSSSVTSPMAIPRASSLPSSTPTAGLPRESPRPPYPVKKLSNPPPSPPPAPAATQIAPIPSHKVLSDHMYQSFLKGTCADVRLYVRKWGVGWHVHKMVLVQAGFFHSLFLGGFSEMTSTSTRKGKGKAVGGDDWHGEDVELTFDDPNITQAAFEICLSRLYSPYPHLHFPSTLLPTPRYPLTPSFPPNGVQSSLYDMQSSLPSSTVLATPRLLLSIVATTIYLGHGNLMREALAMVLRTVGPGTVGRYLSFAVGGGIGDEEWEGQDDQGARGLSGVARPMGPRRESDDSSSADHDTSLPISNPSSTSLSDDGTKVGNAPLPSASERSTPTVRNLLNPDDTGRHSRTPSIAESTSSLPHFYGFASNKLGEACSCWLGRWGVDVLDIELNNPDQAVRIWSHRGLPAAFVRAVLSADTFFVRDEMERYTIARKVLDLRRRGWEVEMEGKGDLSMQESIAESEGESWELWEEDEEELAKVFADGIYYTHMTFEDLSTIAADIDPTTSLPYVPLSVLQAAHWAAADLRNKVLTAGANGTNADANELGISTSATAIAAPDTKRRRVTPRSRVASQSGSSSFSTASAADHASHSQVWHLVPADDTYRMGAGGLLFLTALATAAAPLPGIHGLPDLGPEVDSYSVEGAKPSKFRPPPQGERTQFGLTRNTRTTAELLKEHALSLNGLTLQDTVDQKWTKLDPYRFSVEFWGVDKLAEKERAYSSTHFYAGSWFNVYVQTIRKKDKGTQLGIYLHRQSPNEAFPPPSAPTPDAVGPGLSGKDGAGDDDRVGRSTTTVTGAVTGALGLSTFTGGTRLHRAMSTPPVSLGPAAAGSPPTRLDPPVTPRTNTAALRSPVTPARDGGAGSADGEAERGPYKDPRRVTKAYFSICCSSALGTALIRFASAPDNFTVSQSWGWKSSALRSEEYLTNLKPAQGGSGGVGGTGGAAEGGEESLEEGVLGWVGEVGETECSLRATVVVGVV